MSKLAKDESIVITKADKGNAVVIQNKKDYLEKVQKLMDLDSKNSMFKKLKRDMTVTRERNLQNRIRDLRKNNEINEEIFKKIMSKGLKLKFYTVYRKYIKTVHRFDLSSQL